MVSGTLREIGGLCSNSGQVYHFFQQIPLEKVWCFSTRSLDVAEFQKGMMYLVSG